MQITADYLRSILSYDVETGRFVWLKGPRRGRDAGSVGGVGYCRIGINGKVYFAHRLAWLYVTGSWPGEMVDHKNTIRSDNRWENLRAATRGQNQANSGPYSNNKSGIKGVYPSHRPGKPWVASITKNGRCRRIGRYATKEEAAAAYEIAANRLHGEFARAGV